MATSSAVCGKRLCLSFSGAGFLGIYHLGVLNCLFDNGKTLLEQVDKFAGASSGAMVATIMALGRDKIDVPAAREFVLSVAQEIHKKSLGAFTPGFNIIDKFQTYLHEVLPEDAHTLVSGRLYLSVTNARTRKNELVSQYQSREELIKFILASCCVPGFNGMKSISINNVRYWDGGLTTNLPVLTDHRTIRISPFCGRVEICPRDRKMVGPFISTVGQDLQMSRVNIGRLVQALFPPKRDDLLKYYQRGYQDAKRFLFIQEILEYGTASLNESNSAVDLDDIDFESEKQFFEEVERRKSDASRRGNF